MVYLSGSRRVKKTRIWLHIFFLYWYFIPLFFRLRFSQKLFAKKFREKLTKFRENCDTFRKSFRFRESFLTDMRKSWELMLTFAKIFAKILFNLSRYFFGYFCWFFFSNFLKTQKTKINFRENHKRKFWFPPYTSKVLSPADIV
jgi:hypothetical protein